MQEVGFISERKNQALTGADHPQAARYDHIPVDRRLLDELAPENDGLRKAMLLNGVDLPGKGMFLTCEHTTADVDKTVAAVVAAAELIGY